MYNIIIYYYIYIYVFTFFCFRVPTYPGKSWNLRKEFSRPGKSREMSVEGHGIPPIGRGIWNFFNRRIVIL